MVVRNASTKLEIKRIEKRINKRHSENKIYNQLLSEIYNILGDECSNCGIKDKRLLCIDHINNNAVNHKNNLTGRSRCRGNRNKYIRSILYNPYIKTEYKILCWNCNWLKELERKKTITYNKYLSSLNMGANNE